MYLEGGCAQLSQNECHLPSQAPGGQLQRLAAMAKSQYVTEPLSSSTVAALIDGIDDRQGAAGATESGVNLRRLRRGHQPRRRVATPRSCTATPWRAPSSPRRSMSASRPATTAASQAWLDQIYASVHADLAPQAYQNYIDPTMTDWKSEYYGANLARLQQVKKAVDPDDFFHFAQSIPLP